MTISAAANPQPGGDRRAEIARIAYRVIAQQGMDGFSMRVLAGEAGATTGLVTHHFRDRAAVLEAAHEHAVDVMRSRISSAASPLDALGAILPTDPESIENWRFVLSVRASALVDPTLGVFVENIAGIWHAELPQALEAAGLVADGDAHTAVDHLVAVVDGVSLRATTDPASWPRERQLDHIRRALAAL